MSARPAFNADGLPESVKARCIQKAAQSWCYVCPLGQSFYVTETQAKAMQARSGGTIYPPVAA